MSARRSSAACSNPRERGFTLTEVFVGVALASVVAVAVGSAYVFVTKGWVEHRVRLQTQQQLRSVVAALTREVRLAGACMIPNDTASPADFQPLSGTDNGTTDSIIVRSNPRCAISKISSDDCDAGGCTSFTVYDPTNFASGTWAYLWIDNNHNHQYFRIQSVVGQTITVAAGTPITGSYPKDSTTVFGADVRSFQISTTCTGCNGIPTLTLTLQGGMEEPLVRGVDRLDIHYVLNRNYAVDPSKCDGQTGGSPSLCVVNLPTQPPSVPGDWQLVRVVTFDLGVQSTVAVRGSGSADGFLHLGELFEVAPRNFVFNGVPGRL